MYFWNTYPFVRLSIVLIFGIIAYDHFSKLWEFPLITQFLLFSSCVISILLSNRVGFFKMRHLNGMLAILSVFYLGGFLTKIHHHSHSSNHYLIHKTERVEGFSGTISNSVTERTNHYRYNLRLKAVYKDSLTKCDGIIHLYIRKDSLSSAPFKYGDKVLVYGSFYLVAGPDNPKEFDYRLYLKRQKIYSHAFVEAEDVKLIGNEPPNNILRLAYKLREGANQIINKYVQPKRENAIAKALLIGIKDHLDNDIKKAYSAAGAMHVLAVSGLHIGIIYLLIQSVFGRIKVLGNHGKLIFGILCVVIIWLYAFVTGLSPSVMRAATMFSLIAISKSTTREGNVYNTLGVAAFVLLCHDPYLIYSVGFQLSFAAVIGIVYLQPKLYRLIATKHWLLDKAWSITCVSIAAQLTTFPLSAYYFHQFPTYFLVSNLIVIPGAFIMLLLGISMLIVDLIIPPFSHLLGYLLTQFMWMLNEFIESIQGLPFSLIEWIYVDRIGLILIYLITLTLITGLQFRALKTLSFSTLLFLFFLFTTFKSNQSQSNVKQLVFYEIKNKTVIDHIDGHAAQLYIDDFSKNDLALLAYQIDPFRMASNLSPIAETIAPMSSSFFTEDVFIIGQVANKKILIVDSSTFHLDFSRKIYADILLLNNNSVHSLKWLHETFDYEHLLIGNRNTLAYSRKIKHQAQKEGVKVHSLRQDGAYIIDL